MNKKESEPLMFINTPTLIRNISKKQEEKTNVFLDDLVKKIDEMILKYESGKIVIVEIVLENLEKFDAIIKSRNQTHVEVKKDNESIFIEISKISDIKSVQM